MENQLILSYKTRFHPIFLLYGQNTVSSCFNPGHCFFMLLQMAMNDTAQDLISFKNSTFQGARARTALAESQNHKGWKRLLEIIQSNPLVKEGSLYRLHRKVSRRILNISREGVSQIPMFQLVSIALYPVTGHQ